MNVIRLLRVELSDISREISTQIAHLLVILVVLTVSCPGDAWPNLVSGSVSYSVSGRRAWTVSREEGIAA